MKEAMDEQAAVRPETQQEIDTFAARYPFPLDAFQIEAITHLAENRSVLVAAPTGTGKTLVAEYAIWRAQQRNQRVIYTTPLKALSNQKFRDLRAIYGYDAVGLVTGDIVEHSRACIVIMTTELYRHMLLEDGSDRFATGESGILTSMGDVGAIIFDELHYLSDLERGPVWEEAIICSPPNVQLVGLSATVSNAQDLPTGSAACTGPSRWSCMKNAQYRWTTTTSSITNYTLCRMRMAIAFIASPMLAAKRVRPC